MILEHKNKSNTSNFNHLYFSTLKNVKTNMLENIDKKVNDKPNMTNIMHRILIWFFFCYEKVKKNHGRDVLCWQKRQSHDLRKTATCNAGNSMLPAADATGTRYTHVHWDKYLEINFQVACNIFKLSQYEKCFKGIKL